MDTATSSPKKNDSTVHRRVSSITLRKKQRPTLRTEPSFVKNKETDANTTFWNELYREGNIGNIVGRNYETLITKEDALLILCNYIHINEESLDINHPLIELLSNQSIRHLRHRIQTDTNFFLIVQKYLTQLCEQHQPICYSFLNGCNVEDEKQTHEQSAYQPLSHAHATSDDSLHFVETEAMYEQEALFDDEQERQFTYDWEIKKDETKDTKENVREGRTNNNEPAKSQERKSDIYEGSIMLTPMASLKLSLDAISNSQSQSNSNTKRTKTSHRPLQTLSISVTSENGTVLTLVPLVDRSSNPLANATNDGH
ncbi:hypothetical protein RFI_27542 [Reticulomyxa filosa]|uniref:Uncharacterized protein n=1 Tax=Reticulomyxa filosa TaxID=46433 RepID=X6MA05_RETFI|nr:hypothetical protein RFI_27542 [Reticulomyxa filosa]|eukprot:ETO09835.1 hypothetical protein RFI_27542 [Reticulomyxa filosa]